MIITYLCTIIPNATVQVSTYLIYNPKIAVKEQ